MESKDQVGSSRTVRIVLAFAVLLLSVGAAQSALATQTVKIDSKVKFLKGGPGIRGKVKSKKQACVENRRVKLYRKRQAGGKKLLGKADSKQNGNWKVEFNLTAGTYVAVVKKRREGTAGTIFVCRPAKAKMTID